MAETTLNTFEKYAVISRKTMKQDETNFKNVVMIISFIYAGISSILFFIFLIGFLKGGQLPLLDRLFAHEGPISSLFKAATLLMTLITGAGAIVSFLAGLALMKSGHHTVVQKLEEKKEEEVKNQVPAEVLLDDEKNIIKTLKEHEGAMTQKDLTREVGMNKVKVHRLIKKLEAKKIITKYEFGMTNRIRLEKELKE